MRLMHLCRAHCSINIFIPHQCEILPHNLFSSVRRVLTPIVFLLVVGERHARARRTDRYLIIIFSPSFYFFFHLFIIVDISTALQNQSVLRFSISIEKSTPHKTCGLNSPPTRSFVLKYYHLLPFRFPRSFCLVIHLSSCVQGAGPKRLPFRPQHRFNSIDSALQWVDVTVAWVHGHWHFVTIIQLYRFYINT